MCIQHAFLGESSSAAIGGGSVGGVGDREILPTWVTPSHYDVNITPNLETFKFSGVVNVKYVAT